MQWGRKRDKLKTNNWTSTDTVFAWGTGIFDLKSMALDLIAQYMPSAASFAIFACGAFTPIAQPGGIAAFGSCSAAVSVLFNASTDTTDAANWVPCAVLLALFVLMRVLFAASPQTQARRGDAQVHAPPPMVATPVRAAATVTNDAVLSRSKRSPAAPTPAAGAAGPATPAPSAYTTPLKSASSSSRMRERRRSSFEKVKDSAQKMFQAARAMVTPPSSPRAKPPRLLRDAVALRAVAGAMRQLVDAHRLGRDEGDGWKLHSVQKKTGCHVFTQRVDGCTWTKGVGTLQLPPYVAAAFLQDVEKKRLYDVLFRRKCHVELVTGREIERWRAMGAAGPLPPGALGLPAGATVLRLAVDYAQFFRVFPTAPRDGLTVGCYARGADGSCMVAHRTVAHPAVPAQVGNHVRATVLCAGTIFTPLHDRDAANAQGGDGRAEQANGGGARGWEGYRARACEYTTVAMANPGGQIPMWVVNTQAPKRATCIEKLGALLDPRKGHRTRWAPPLPLDANAASDAFIAADTTHTTLADMLEK